jgi:antitoxin FitA
MAQVSVEDINPVILEKLEALAKRHGRSLQAQIKHILEQAAQTEATPTKQFDMAAARVAAFRMRQQLAGGIHTDSAELLREDRER